MQNRELTPNPVPGHAQLAQMASGLGRNQRGPGFQTGHLRGQGSPFVKMQYFIL